MKNNLAYHELFNAPVSAPDSAGLNSFKHDKNIQALTRIFGNTFVDCMTGKEFTGNVGGYKLILVLYTAAWCPHCAPFKEQLRNYCKIWNQNGK